MKIPGGLYNRVGVGETGIAIARAYRLVWANIVALFNAGNSHCP